MNMKKSEAEYVYGIDEGQLVIRVYALDDSRKRTASYTELRFSTVQAEYHVAQCVRHIAAMKGLYGDTSQKAARP